MNKIEMLLGERPNMQASNALPTKKMGGIKTLLDWQQVYWKGHIFLMEFSMNGWTCPFIYDLDMSSVILEWKGVGLTLKVSYMNLFLH